MTYNRHIKTRTTCKGLHKVYAKHEMDHRKFNFKEFTNINTNNIYNFLLLRLLFVTPIILLSLFTSPNHQN